MKAETLSQTDVMILPLIAVVLFVGIFIAAVAWVFRPGGKVVYARHEALPFDDEPPAFDKAFDDEPQP